MTNFLGIYILRSETYLQERSFLFHKFYFQIFLIIIILNINQSIINLSINKSIHSSSPQSNLPNIKQINLISLIINQHDSILKSKLSIRETLQGKFPFSLNKDNSSSMKRTLPILPIKDILLYITFDIVFKTAI